MALQTAPPAKWMGTNNVPDQSKSLPGLLSASATTQGRDRKIGDIPSYVTGPASRACGGCHRAALINEDTAGELQVFNHHTKQGGYMVEAGEDPATTLTNTHQRDHGRLQISERSKVGRGL